MNDPYIRILHQHHAAGASGVVLVLHGGTANSHARVRPTHLAYRRMLPLARAAYRATGHRGTAVWVLRNRLRGWNAPRMDPVTDARWALAVIRRTHPGAGIALVGHSMGGRVALHLADEPGVHSVCALAPWTTESDPVEQLLGRTVLIVHGDRDRTIPAHSSLTYARRATEIGAEVTRQLIAGSGHAMLRRVGEWTERVRGFAVECAGAGSPR